MQHSAMVKTLVRKRSLASATGAALVALTLLPVVGLADNLDQPPQVSPKVLALEEIIITASKRESLLLETAAAVSAFDASTLQQLSIQNALDIVVHTPSLSMTDHKISIRGVGRPSNAIGSDPGVGVYLDGVYNTENGSFRFANFFDIERIEVLRGPQGTLYGRNTVGGAINLISKKPGDEWGGELVAEGDNYSIKYTGGYTQYAYDYAIDADATAAKNSGLDWSQLFLFGLPVSALTGYDLTPSDMTYTIDQEATFVSHQVQLSSNFEGPLNVISGLYYYHSEEDQLVAFHERNNDLMAVYAFFGGLIGKPVSEDNFLYRGEADLDTKSYAVYGQAAWDWTANTVLTAGLRYSEDHKNGGDNTFVQFVGDVNPPTVFRKEEDDWSQYTWRLGVDHTLDENQFLYAFIATGYRSGGFNFQKPTSSSDVDVVDPEDLLSVELGYKASLFDKRMNVSAA
ncbi:MAG: outer membrane receptor protein involved in Fe transport, partial [Halioglobus sp.]